MEKRPMTLKFEAEQVEKVYTGRDSGCRCGCHGTYTYRVDNPVIPREIACNGRVKSSVTRARKLVASGEGKITDSNESYLNVSFGNDRAICIYFK
jgi:hypothetical protein